MTERRGEWPTWIVATGCGAAFFCGLFVAWAVFAEPARAENHEARPPDQFELLSRIDALEASIEALSTVADTKSSGKIPQLEAVMLTTSFLKVVDTKGRMRMSMTALEDSPRIEMNREDKSFSMVLTEQDGEPTIALYDTTGKQRVELSVQKTGTAIVRLIDEKGKVRLGMISTSETEAEFIRIDKFGNQKVVQ